jgi:HSP20 family protein
MARTTISRFDPFAELSDVRSRFERLLGDLADGHEHGWTPAVDMLRDDGHLVVRAEVPGIKPEELEIQVDEDVLTISGRHDETKEKEDKQYVRRERRVGAFSRSMALPAGVDPKRIKATTHDGVLEVTVPLPKESVREPVTIKPTVA